MNDEMIENRKCVEAKDQGIFSACASGRGVYLNLGCGDRVLGGFLNMDKFTRHSNIVPGDLLALPFKNDSVNLIFSAHSLEHLPIRESKRALMDWYRVLKPGGRLILEVPDLETICRCLLLYNAHPRFTWFLYTMFGYQIDPRNPDKIDAPRDLGQFHMSGHTKDTISAELRQLGFEIRELLQYDGYATPSLHVDAYKKESLV